MKVSIIDIGTQSLKHYIFEVEGSQKKLLHYKRYSEANLGESDSLSKETIDRTIKILNECLLANQELKVIKLEIVGTEILRKARNASDFTSVVKELSGKDIQIISQDQEALYLYQGFIKIIPPDLSFAAMNIGGGSTEVVIGNNLELVQSTKIPFGVKFMKKNFSAESGMDWKRIDEYLAQNITLDSHVENIFVTGVLDFISAVGPHLGFIFEKCSIPNHPIKFTMEKYEEFLDILRNTSIDDLKKLYPKDPGYADNFAIGQSVYVAIARKLSAVTIIPSNNDLTDGVIHQMLVK